ncbi:MAG: Holliday junction resolvase RuvX [Oscillospiraceae bacterium]
MKILGVDFGDARTGIACCDKMEMLASPVTVICDKDMDSVAEKTVAAAKENRCELIVIGLPKNMDGSCGFRADICTEFAKKVEALTQIPVTMWDERSTTVSAINYLNITDTRGKKRKAVVDAVAATIILDSYLCYRKNNKNAEVISNHQSED